MTTKMRVFYNDYMKAKNSTLGRTFNQVGRSIYFINVDFFILPVMGREIGHANFARPGELKTRIARRICQANKISRIEFPGDFGPIWYKDEYLIPDFNESGTGYYIAPAWVLEKAGYHS